MNTKSSASEASGLLATQDPKEMAKVESAQKQGKDYGPWKYEPWDGVDHWVHEETKESTFDLKKVATA